MGTRVSWMISVCGMVLVSLCVAGSYLFFRERQWVGVPPEITLPNAGVGAEGARIAAPDGVIFFPDSAVVQADEDERGGIGNVHVSDVPVGQTSGRVFGERKPEEERRRHPDADAILAAFEANEREKLIALQERLIAGGDGSLVILEDLLGAGVWRAEVFAMDILRRLETPGSRLIAIGHLLTRPEWKSRGWHRLAYQAGHMMDGNTVDLMVGMLEDAEGDARARIMRLLSSARSEDALFRLYMISEEHSDADIRSLAAGAVFKSRRSGSIEILKDIMVSQENVEVSAQAAMGLANWSSGLKFLVETANAGDQKDAVLARWAIEQASRPQNHLALRQIAIDSNNKEEVRLAAVRALGGNHGNKRMVRRYLQYVASNADAVSVREAAAGYLLEVDASRNPG